MKIHATEPTGQAQSFDVNETFFSTTDARGIIMAGNQVFCRTSGYAFEEMVGQPHNLIRHREMPRQVFRLLWETVRLGRTFMGYVKNQARNGNHYWVFAVIVPLPQGFLSVRIKPTSPLLARIEPVYRALLDAEQAAIAAGQSESQAADASAETLRQALDELGFADYAAFSHHALNTEIKSRDAEVAGRGLRLFPAECVPDKAADETETARHGRESLRALYAQVLTAYESVNALFGSLDAFIAICAGIRERQDAVQEIAEDFRLNALNAHIAANPLGADGITLGTVAQILNGHGQSLSRNVAGLADNILHTTTAVADVASNLSAARIQIEMLLSFLAEIGRGQHGRAERHKLGAMTGDLRTGFIASAEQVFRAIDALHARLPTVLWTKEQLRKDIVYLQVAQISGLIEVSRLTKADGLYATFTGLREQIENGKRELGQLDVVVENLATLAANTPAQVQALRRSISALNASGTISASWSEAAMSTLDDPAAPRGASDVCVPPTPSVDATARFEIGRAAE